MKFNYNKTSDALSIRFNNKPYKESDEVSEGVIFDYDNSGRIIGMEILDASKKMPKEISAQFSKKGLPITFDLARA